MTSLADTVLPLIRTRADLHRWRAANAHGSQMHAAIDMLDAALATADPGEVHAVVHAALASAIKVIARADDSSGIIGDACHRLLSLHPQTAAAAQVAPSKLVDWMIKFQFDGDVDYFEIDPVVYAPALGHAGMRAYRERLDSVRAELGPEPAESDRGSVPDRHERWVLDWNDRRLAVFDRDIEAIVRTHARNRRVAAWLDDTAHALAEIGEFDLAIDWARQAAELGPWHQSLKAADFWCDLLMCHHPDQLLAARADVFRWWPSSTTATHLHRTAGSLWPDYHDEVLAMLATRPDEAVLFALGALNDPRLAWGLADSLGLDDDRAWGELAKAYERIDALAVLPIHQRLVERDLVTADAHHYRLAARRLAKMRTLATGSDRAADIDGLIANLRGTHRRRPRLQQEFNRAGLP